MTLENYSDEWVPRTIRIPRDLWDAARDVAVKQDDNVSRVIRAALVAYVDKDARKRAASQSPPPKRAR